MKMDLRKCLACGAEFEFYAHATAVATGRGKYCSLTCRPNPTNRSHGMSYTITYRSWSSMRARCLNPATPNFALYGGRGITVCERWGSFEAFLADVGTRPDLAHSLDRINTDGDYEPGNCRWATVVEQGNNRRTNRYVEALGRRQTVAQWVAETGIPQTTITSRLASGMAPDAAVTVPPRPNEKAITFRGETLNLKGWAARLGLSASALTVRFNRGWPVERALAPATRKLPTRRAAPC